MAKQNDAEVVVDDYLKTLEKVKKQYQQYMEVSELYKLSTPADDSPVQFRPPSPDNPLTTNTVRINYAD